MYDALPKNERAFDVDLTGDTSYEKFSGQFIAKCILTMAEKHAKELDKTRLMADYANPSSDLAGIAETLSTIRAKLVKWPDWWENLDYGSKVRDENVILKIYNEILRLEQEWRSEVRKASLPPAKEEPKGNA